MRQFSQPLRTGTKVPRLHPVTGCRGHPCPRRCGTHGGCRIKLKRDNRCHHNLRQCSHDFLIDSCRHTHIATPELQPIRELARRQLHACLSSRTDLSARSRSRVRRPFDGRDRRESKISKNPLTAISEQCLFARSPLWFESWVFGNMWRNEERLLAGWRTPTGRCEV